MLDLKNFSLTLNELAAWDSYQIVGVAQKDVPHHLLRRYTGQETFCSFPNKGLNYYFLILQY